MNKNISSLLRKLDRLSPPKHVHAHCDIPCGVYEVDSMKWAVETCMKMVEKITGLSHSDSAERPAHVDYMNTLIRSVHEKEEYAQICKEQILILWTDYFKPEHLEKWPSLHDKVWKATKQCSVVKRTVDIEEVNKLKEMVDEVSEIFLASKK